jgi:hypothetical protein
VFLHDKFGITSLHRFIVFLAILFFITAWGIRRKQGDDTSLPVISWLVPFWFHLFFFAWLFLRGFYKENMWLVVASGLNMLIAIRIHLLSIKKEVTVNSPAQNEISMNYQK